MSENSTDALTAAVQTTVAITGSQDWYPRTEIITFISLICGLGILLNVFNLVAFFFRKSDYSLLTKRPLEELLSRRIWILILSFSDILVLIGNILIVIDFFTQDTTVPRSTFNGFVAFNVYLTLAIAATACKAATSSADGARQCGWNHLGLVVVLLLLPLILSITLTVVWDMIARSLIVHILPYIIGAIIGVLIELNVYGCCRACRVKGAEVVDPVVKQCYGVLVMYLVFYLLDFAGHIIHVAGDDRVLPEGQPAFKFDDPYVYRRTFVEIISIFLISFNSAFKFFIYRHV